MSANTPTVIDSNQDSFDKDVIEASKARPVVVDFWASWCQPCRILAPVLERVVGEFEGRLSLVKLETEQAPEIAARFGIRSIPAVLGFRDGKVVDSFVGVLPESAIRSWLERLFPTPGEVLA
ncbi:thioredoxin, partial [Singulisphaera rosea]